MSFPYPTRKRSPAVCEYGERAGFSPRYVCPAPTMKRSYGSGAFASLAAGFPLRQRDQRGAQRVAGELGRVDRLVQNFAAELAREALERDAIDAIGRNDFEAQVERVRDRRGALEIGRRIEIRVDERRGHRGAPGLYDRQRKAVDRAQQQLAQHVERLLFEDSR